MATKLSTFLATPDTGTAASHYYVETAGDGFIRPKTLANVKAEIVTTAVLGTGTANSSYILLGDRTWSNILGANTLTIGTGTYFVANGNVGIGTSGPAYTLEASGVTKSIAVTGTGNPAFYAISSDAAGIPFLILQNGSYSWQNRNNGASGDLSWAVSGSERMRITLGGNLVIGNGDTAASPISSTLRTTNGSGTDIAGASLTIQGGRGTGTGAGGSIIFSTSLAGTTGSSLNAATERMRIDASGNVGIGVTPSAWGPTFKALDINTYGSVASTIGAMRVFGNTYYDGTNWIYKSTAAATRYEQSTGYHAWFNAPSGTAGSAIPFTQAMTLDASGNVGIGTSSPAGLATLNFTVQNPATFATTSITSGSYTSTQLSNVNFIESFGARNDGNVSFGGRFAASYRRADGTAIASNAYLGIYAFGGQWGTDTTYQQAKQLYPASIIGIAEGSFTSATAMATGLSFRTGSTGYAIDAANVPYGTEAMRITSAGNVGIGTSSGLSKAYVTTTSSTAYGFISQTPVVGLTAGDFVNMAYFADTRSASNDGLRIVNVRDSAGSSSGDWGTSSYRIRRSVDQTDASSGVQEEIVFGNSLLSFNTAGSERLRISSAGAITQLNATSGAGAIVGEQTFLLTGTPTAIGPAIADFFGATSSISLEASSTYEIVAYAAFLKTTANTVTWTMTASSAPTRMQGWFIGSPVTGIGQATISTGTSGVSGSQAATTAAFAATASLTTAVNHNVQMTMLVQTNAATNWRLQITSGTGAAGGGTVTPLVGSYYKVKKISTTTGTFV